MTSFLITQLLSNDLNVNEPQPYRVSQSSHECYMSRNPADSPPLKRESGCIYTTKRLSKAVFCRKREQLRASATASAHEVMLLRRMII